MTIGDVVETLIYLRDSDAVRPRSKEDEAICEACNLLDRLHANDEEATTYEPVKN